MLTRLPLRLRVLLIFAGLAAVVLGSLLLALWVAESVALAGLIAGAGALVAIAAVWFLFDCNVARPIEMLAGGLRTGQAGDPQLARWLADLGPAARDAAEARAHSAASLAQALRDHASDLEQEKALLASILADIGAAAVMTDAGGRIVFYNASAAHLLPGIVLDRPITGHLAGAALTAAQARLVAGTGATDIRCLSLQGVPLWGRMRRIDEDGTLLILRDRPRQQPLPRDLLEALRRHAATLVPMLEALDGPIPPALARAIQDEGRGLAASLRDLGAKLATEAPVGRAALTELAAGLDLAPAPPLTLLADADGVNGLLRHLDGQLRDMGITPRLVAGPDASETQAEEAWLTLTWTGPPVAMDRLEHWLSLPPDPAQPDLTGHDILAAHATGIWSEAGGAGARLVLPLRIAPKMAGADPGLTYDFTLSRRAGASDRLADLTCVVFDTETTGLGPSDRIVQIAGVRIAGGRLTGERFETLVNPGRPIPPASTEVHGITDAMVADAPDMTAALTAFHHFAEDTVLVAHNAPFDMGFLRNAQPETGARFDNRVLDTVLLSAMLWGQSAPHSLDALTARLGITIPAGERHTAMGDTLATARVYLRLIEALRAKGLERFGDILTEARRHRRLVEDANIKAAAARQPDP